MRSLTVAQDVTVGPNVAADVSVDTGTWDAALVYILATGGNVPTITVTDRDAAGNALAAAISYTPAASGGQRLARGSGGTGNVLANVYDSPAPPPPNMRIQVAAAVGVTTRVLVYRASQSLKG